MRPIERRLIALEDRKVVVDDAYQRVVAKLGETAPEAIKRAFGDHPPKNIILTVIVSPGPRQPTAAPSLRLQ